MLSCKDDVRTQSLEGRTAMTKPQFATGPQKCVVIGPVGLLMNVLAHWAIPTEAMTMMADERASSSLSPPPSPSPSLSLPLFFFLFSFDYCIYNTPWLYF